MKDFLISISFDSDSEIVSFTLLILIFLQLFDIDTMMILKEFFYHD